MKRFRKVLAAFVTTAALAAAFVAAVASPAAADYGPSALYQVEITANASSGGIWLWIELTPSPGSTTTGTGDYQGSSCHHGSGATHEAGDVTWSSSGGTLTISGVVIHGFGFPIPVTITVPSTYGHYSYPTGAFASIFSGLPPFPSRAQVQVAP